MRWAGSHLGLWASLQELDSKVGVIRGSLTEDCLTLLDHSVENRLLGAQKKWETREDML